jgi:hypothetical protein
MVDAVGGVYAGRFEEYVVQDAGEEYRIRRQWSSSQRLTTNSSICQSF